MTRFQTLLAAALLLSVPTHAQLIDTIGAMGLSGQMATQGAKSAAGGMNALKQTQVLQNLNLVVMNIKMSHMGGYAGVNKSSAGVQNPFGGLDWMIGSDTPSTFYVELNAVPAALCEKLTAPGLGTQKVLVNGLDSKSTNCSSTSKIKLIYE